MKPSKRTKNKATKKAPKIMVDPYELIGKYFTSRSPIVEQDIMKILFVLYCVKKNIPMTFVGSVLAEEQGIADPLYHRLRNAATGGRNDHQFVIYLLDMYKAFSGSAKTIINATYAKLLKYVVMGYGKMNETVVFPQTPLLTTVANIVSDYGCKSVHLFNDNLGALSWFLDDDIKVYAHNDSEYHNIIRDMLHDALGFDMDIISHTETSKTDALVSFTGVDFYFAQGDSYDKTHVSKSNLQLASLRSFVNNDHADILVFLLHHRVANNYEYIDLRKKICEDGILDMVITLPNKIFTDAKVATSLVVINKKKQDDKVTFIAADSVFKDYASKIADIDIRKAVSTEEKIEVSFAEMAEYEWAFNAHLYIQDAVCQEGQELVPLKDLVEFKSGYNCDPKGDESISDRSCSDNVVDALCNCKYYKPKPWAGYHEVSGPAVIFNVDRDFKMRATVYTSTQTRLAYMSCYSLVPDTNKILPQYLAYVILTDKSFERYIKHVLEYYADVDGIRHAYLLNRKIPIYRDILKQQEVVRPFIKEEHASTRHNVILAFSDDRAMNNDYMSILAEKNIRVLGTASTIAQMNFLLNKYASETASSNDKVDAVLIDADIKCGLQAEEGKYDGLIELSFICDRYKLPFYLISPGEVSKLPVPRRCLSYFTESNTKRHFTTGLNSFRELIEAMCNELESEVSDDSLLRNKYPEFFEAADWLDGQRPGKNFATNITAALKQDMNLTQDEMNKSVNELRILAEDLFKWLQEVNLAPKGLTPGGVAILLRDKICGDYKYTDESIMDRALASMLATLYDIGNDGSHKFLFTDLFKRTAVLSLMAFVQWVYQNRDLFSRTHNGFYRSKSQIEVHEFEDVVKCDDSRGELYYYTRDVHLGTKIQNISAGDKVRVSNYKYESNPRHDLGVIYYSSPDNWSKIK